MIEQIISTGTVTYAIKGRDILRRKGFKAYIERRFGEQSIGCGYTIVVASNSNEPERILRDAGIKILDIKKK